MIPAEPTNTTDEYHTGIANNTATVPAGTVKTEFPTEAAAKGESRCPHRLELLRRVTR